MSSTIKAAETLESIHSDKDEGARGRFRRRLVGTGIAGAAAALFGVAAARAQADQSGPLSSATISFGAWMLPADRHPNLFPRPANHHEMCPHEVKVKAGACVNFVIAGVHQVVIYDDGTQPGDIDTSLTIPATNPLPSPLINDPDRRIYRGLDPSLFPLERVEVVHFSAPGTYLVICGVLRHFNEGMVGYVTVLP